MPHHLALVLLRLHLLVVHHGLEPVVPVADGVIGAAGQPLCNLVPAVAGGRAGVGATARTSGAGRGARHVWPSAGERFGVVDAQANGDAQSIRVRARVRGYAHHLWPSSCTPLTMLTSSAWEREGWGN